MEVFKIWLGNYGLVVRQDCPYYPSEEFKFSVTKFSSDVVRLVRKAVESTELIDCCLEKAEAKTLVDAAIIGSKLDNDDLIINVAQGFNW
jgi:hypothetical protein